MDNFEAPSPSKRVRAMRDRVDWEQLQPTALDSVGTNITGEAL